MQSHRTLVRSDTAPARPGQLLTESLVAMLIVGSVVASTIPVVMVFQRGARQQSRLILAHQELQNQLEWATRLPYAELTSSRLKEVQPSPEVREQLPQPVLQLTVEDTTQAPAGKRVIAELSWQKTSGVVMAPVRCVAWVYPRQEGQP